jgi:hypothetical protein
MYQSMEGFDYREMEGEEQTFAPPIYEYTFMQRDREDGLEVRPSWLASVRNW